MPLRLVVFDMDGVVFEGANFWLDLHREYGTEREALELAASQLETNYKDLAHYTATKQWQGRDASPLERLVKARQYEPGIRELIQWLKRHKVATALISSGPFQLALRAKKELGIDVIRANNLHIRKNRLTGVLDLQVDDSNKGAVVREILEQLGLTRHESAAVGDKPSDLGLAREVSFFVAYDTEDTAVVEEADYTCPKGSLVSLIEVFTPLLGWDPPVGKDH